MTNEGIAPLRVPTDLMARCEAVAVKRRKATGQNVGRAEIAREAIRIGLVKLEEQSEKRKV